MDLFAVTDRASVARHIEVEFKGAMVTSTGEALCSNGPTNDSELVILLQLRLLVRANTLRHC